MLLSTQKQIKPPKNTITNQVFILSILWHNMTEINQNKNTPFTVSQPSPIDKNVS